MTPAETLSLARLTAVAYDRDVPNGLPEIWHAALGDLPFGIAREAVVELIRTLAYWPKPAEIRERARLIHQQQQRDAAKRRQLDDRQRFAITAATDTQAALKRTGADMVRHVLGRLKDAGQDVPNGKYLGKERAGDIAYAAVEEWLDRTEPDH